ncbi:serine acetyltransferase [bacterium]|nr:serine acetyltransferase [bacterium]
MAKNEKRVAGAAKRVESSLAARREIPLIVNRILESFDEPNSMAHLDKPSMPAEPAVVRALELLQSVLFPGYIGRYEIESHNLIYYIGELTIKIFDELSRQLEFAYQNHEPSGDAVDFRERGRRTALAFLEKIPRIRRLLSTDVIAAHSGDPAAKNYDEIIFCYPGLKAVMIYRIAHELHKLGVPFIPRIMTEYAHRDTGIDIHPGATIGEGFFIDHGTGVVIGETTVIGRHVQIYQGVTLGALRFHKDEHGNVVREQKRHPTIEDNVTIYAQATILGGKTVIGEGSIIGGNVWLTNSVPPFSVVQLETAKVTLRKNVERMQTLDYSI